MSIRIKVIIFVILGFIISGFSTIYISHGIFVETGIDQNKMLAKGTSELITQVIDPERIQEYLEKGRDAPGYTETENALKKIGYAIPSIKYIYVYKILPDGCHVVFDLPTENGEEEASKPGDIVPFDKDFDDVLPELIDGHRIDAIISNGKYGWLLTYYTPVYDKNGICQCYACCDISMDWLSGQINNLHKKLLINLLVILIFVVIILLFSLNYTIVKPINKIACASREFAYTNEEEMGKSLVLLEDIKIRTKDEIGNLYTTLLKMAKNSVENIQMIKNKNETLAQLQSALIITLADIVESRDQNTGQHIRKTAAYTRIIMEELRKTDKYKDIITDLYMEDVYNSAPLHDIGKISVPDAILNKPGKLTDEEFAKMKKHTIYGADIIENIISLVPESHYLDEAVSLAYYHHEKWNGKGYPAGLSGDTIPLSARIMAVADVFDALVSKRSYKDGFPLEKAFAIIQEESGTHFDPDIVAAFFAAKSRVIEIANEFNKIS